MQKTSAVVVALLLLLSTGPAAGIVHSPPTVEAERTTTAECKFPVSVTDATGTEVTASEEPERIVTLAPSAAQTIWEIGGKDKVVGVSQFATFLEGTENRTTVTSGFPSQVNIEKVISLNPDLVLAPNTTKMTSVSQLRDAGITVYHVPLAESFEDIYEKTERFGSLSGQCSKANSTVEGMKTNIETVESAVSDVDSPRSLYELGNLIVAGPDTFIGKVLAKAGTTNIAAAASSTRSYPQLSSEFVLEQNPAYIVTGVAPDKIDSNPADVIPEDSVLRETKAWKNDNIITVDRNSISQPAPRIVEPMVKIVKEVHPDAYEAANLDTIIDEDGAPERVPPTSYSSTVLGDGSARLDVQLNYFEEETADFRIPDRFEANRSVYLRGVQVTPEEPNWDFGVEVTRISSGPSLPSSAQPLTGYRFTPHGMWPDTLETLNVSTAINATQLGRNATTAEILAYTKTGDGWSALDTRVQTSNGTVNVQASLSTYQAVYFALAPESATKNTSTTVTPTTTAKPPQTTPGSVNLTTSDTTASQNTEVAPPATESASTTATSTQPSQPSSTPSITVPGFGVGLAAVAVVMSFVIQLTGRK